MSEKLRMSGITKVYDNGVVANRDVDLSLNVGEIHALAGENGAGKSTVMKVLYGLCRPDAGSICLDGQPVVIRSPRDAMALHIGMVHQHFMLVEEMRVYENIFLGFAPKKGLFLDKKTMLRKTEELCRRYGMQVPAEALCGSLSVGLRQKVEILKALARGAELLILDEPTAVLTPQETEELFTQLRALRSNGLTTVIITHKLAEIFALCDRVTVMRGGRSMGVYDVAGMTEEGLSRLMVGRDVELTVDKTPAVPGEPVLSVRDLRVSGAGGKNAVDGVSFTVHKGEIVCIAGVEGNGQKETVDCITGLRKPDAGHIILSGAEITGKRVRLVRGAGISHIPSDRLSEGASAAASVYDNLIAVDHANACTAGFLHTRALRKKAKAALTAYGIKAGGIGTKLAMLSGGNMQKVVVAREMETPHTVLIADQPTRGVDVGAIEAIHRRIVEERDRGKAVLLVSADLAEVFSLADRILVFADGRMTANIRDVAHMTQERLGQYMLGLARMEEEALNDA